MPGEWHSPSYVQLCQSWFHQMASGCTWDTPQADTTSQETPCLANTPCTVRDNSLHATPGWRSGAAQAAKCLTRPRGPRVVVRQLKLACIQAPPRVRTRGSSDPVHTDHMAALGCTPCRQGRCTRGCRRWGTCRGQPSRPLSGTAAHS